VSDAASHAGLEAVPAADGAMLRCEGVSRLFGGIAALTRVDFTVRRDEIVALVGPNGSGKTTLVNAITGFYPPQQGRIMFDGADITGLRPHRVAQRGIARTFQNLALFRGMSVLDNILLGRHIHMRPGALSTACYWWWARRAEVLHRRVVEEIVDFMQLAPVRHEPVEILPLGLQKCVELARALVAEPKLLILDEPMTGMNQEEKEYMARFILDVHAERRLPVLLIEHHLDVVIGISNRLAVLSHGQKIAEGVPREVVSDPNVVSAYLGGVGRDAA
jgi:branched-chain amino acid transport system ATP-binding protein